MKKNKKFILDAIEAIREERIITLRIKTDILLNNLRTFNEGCKTRKLIEKSIEPTNPYKRLCW